MHLLKGQPRGITERRRAGRPRADRRATSSSCRAADTEIAGLAAARRALGERFPSRAPRQLDAARASLFGRSLCREGAGARQARRAAAARRRRPTGATASTRRCGSRAPTERKLVVVPGDATWDAALAARRNGRRRRAREGSGRYLVEGGSENLANALRYCAHLIGEGEEPPEARPLPSAGRLSRQRAARPSALRAAGIGARASDRRRSSSTARWSRRGRPSRSMRSARRSRSAG